MLSIHRLVLFSCLNFGINGMERFALLRTVMYSSNTVITTSMSVEPLLYYPATFHQDNSSVSLENDDFSSTGRSGSKQYGIIPTGSDKEATYKASSLVTSDEEYTKLVSIK